TNKCKEPRDYTPVASITQSYLYNDHHIYDTQPSGLFCTLDKMAAHLHTLQSQMDTLFYIHNHSVDQSDSVNHLLFRFVHVTVLNLDSESEQHLIKLACRGEVGFHITPHSLLLLPYSLST